MDGWVGGWVGGWVDGWVDGSKSRVKDCLQQSKINDKIPTHFAKEAFERQQDRYEPVSRLL